ncbi:MAG: LysE family translocator [Pseudomonadota bacterium]
MRANDVAETVSMETLTLLAAVAFLQIAAASSPGPNFILVSTYASSASRRAAMMAVAGIVVGILIWSSLAILGLCALVSSSPTAYQILQYFGAVYLAWIGASLLKSSFQKQLGDGMSQSKQNGPSPFLRGFFVNIGNPKTIVFYTSLFAVLVPSSAEPVLLAAIIVVDALACAAWWLFVALAFGTAPVKRFFRNFQVLIDRLFGFALIALGVNLAFGRN